MNAFTCPALQLADTLGEKNFDQNLFVLIPGLTFFS